MAGVSAPVQRLKWLFRTSNHSRRFYSKFDRRTRVNVARSGPSSSHLVSQCARELGMEVEYRAKPDCDLYWHRHDYLAQTIPRGGFVSITPGIAMTFSKSTLGSLLNRMQKLFLADYQFYPRSWSYPEEHHKLDKYIKQKKELGQSPTFISKPSEGSQGVGIYLFKDIQDITDTEPVVVQEYINNPLLLDGVKFDLRLYVLVSSFNPLEAYISSCGLVRFCTVPYETPTIDNLSNDYIHLTNYAVNKNNAEYSLKSCKRTLIDTLDHVGSQHDVTSFWTDVKELVAKTLIAVLPTLHVESRSYMLERILDGPLNCFQLLGFDVMMDENCKLYLLEVNSNPSQDISHERVISPGVVEVLDSDIDAEIKKLFMTDCLKIMQRKILKCDHLASDTSYMRVPLDYPHLMLLEQCRQLFSSISNGVELELSDFTNFVKDFKLISNEKFDANTTAAVFTQLSAMDGRLSFDKFIATLHEISRRLYGENSDVVQLQRMLKHCRIC